MRTFKPAYFDEDKFLKFLSMNLTNQRELQRIQLPTEQSSINMQSASSWESPQIIQYRSMVGRKKKSRRKKGSLGNHQRSWIWGQHAVVEMLRSGRWQPESIVLCEDLIDDSLLSEVKQRLNSLSLTYETVDAAEIEKLVHARDHQGFAARMTEFPSLTFEELKQQLPENPFILIIDRIQDPYNFGSILRSADLFGVDGVIIADKEQVGVTSHVARSSVGAVNFVNITVVDSLVKTAKSLLDDGYQIVAATEKGSVSPADIDLSSRVAIAIGNEGKGIQVNLLELCNQHCAIPQVGHVDSLNAAVATGILCYEVHRQRTS